MVVTYGHARSAVIILFLLNFELDMAVAGQSTFFYCLTLAPYPSEMYDVSLHFLVALGAGRVRAKSDRPRGAVEMGNSHLEFAINLCLWSWYAIGNFIIHD